MTVYDFAAAARRRDQLAVLAAAPAQRIKDRNEAVLRRAGVTKKVRRTIARAVAIRMAAGERL